MDDCINPELSKHLLQVLMIRQHLPYAMNDVWTDEEEAGGWTQFLLDLQEPLTKEYYTFNVLL